MKQAESTNRKFRKFLFVFRNKFVKNYNLKILYTNKIKYNKNSTIIHKTDFLYKKKMHL